jgi:hypothetical protein
VVQYKARHGRQGVYWPYLQHYQVGEETLASLGQGSLVRALILLGRSVFKNWLVNRVGKFGRGFDHEGWMEES